MGLITERAQSILDERRSESRSITVFRSKALDDEDRATIIKLVQDNITDYSLCKLLSTVVDKPFTKGSATPLINAIRSGEIGAS